MVFIGPLKVGGAGCQVAPASPDPLIHPAGLHQVNPRVAYGNLSHVPNALRSLIGKGRRESKRLMVTQQQRKIGPPGFGRSCLVEYFSKMAGKEIFRPECTLWWIWGSDDFSWKKRRDQQLPLSLDWILVEKLGEKFERKTMNSRKKWICFQMMQLNMVREFTEDSPKK